jgi:HAMP domain-containing protein
MKSIKNLFVIIPAIIVVSTIVGFFITFPSAPQSAYARIFIDLGVLIALLSVCMTIPKPRKIRTDGIVNALRDLARGRYETRLNSKDFDELNPIAQAFNELAGSLSDSGDPKINQLRYEYIRNQEPVATAERVFNEQHSHHPELGHVEAVTRYGDDSAMITPRAQEELSMVPTPAYAENSLISDFSSSVFESVSSKTSTAAQDLPQKPTVPKGEIEELYGYFCDAHHQLNKEPINFEEFRATVEKAREDLQETHHCRGVRFEIVMESNEVALRPRLIR